MARTLKLTSPPMHGADVRLLQEAINAQFKRWGVSYSIEVDREYGPNTREAYLAILHGLGIASSELAKGATPALRTRVRRRLLTPTELVRYRARASWRKALVRRYEGHGTTAALRWARSQIGVKEQPAGSNRGKLIDQWQKLCGIIAAPWCGCFVNRALMAGGFPAQSWLRYCPWIEQKARAGEGGWSWHSTSAARKGDLILYGVREAQHVGIVEDPQSSTTIEGNTSSGNAGSQDNGGMVAIRNRDWGAAGFPARGVARPPWGRVT